MHPENHLYGGSQILALYVAAGRPLIDPWSPPSIRGRLQGSWDLTGTAVERAALALPDFVWSDETRHRRMAQGLPGGFALGAPWIYAQTLSRADFRSEEELQDRPDPEPAMPPARGTLYLPTHGLDGVYLARRTAAYLRATCGVATVALTSSDDAVPAVRAAYESAGHVVVALGRYDDEPGTAQPRYLVRLRDLFAEHEQVGANVPRTELLYAANAGRPVRLDGPAPSEMDPFLTQLGHRLSGLDESDWRAYADRELGVHHLVPPRELRILLDWTSHD